MTNSALALIDSIIRMRSELRADPQRLAAFERLQQWQVARLHRTYADCYDDWRYRDALEFFIRDLYGPHDFEQRDRDLQKVMRMWYRLLPQRALEAVTEALELEVLSQTLDMNVAEALGTAAVTEESYAAAYRRANRREQRQRQIWLIVQCGRSLQDLVDHPWIASALRMARRPARLSGVSTLHEFLERGYAAFAKLNDTNDLLKTIERCETRIMQRLFAGAPRPFDVSDAPDRARRKA